MTDLFLIAHKVRGEPAFDIAQHLTCPKCEGTDDHCSQCDGAGHWWIIPTSGHRAFPYWHEQLDHCIDTLYIDGDPNRPHVPPDGLRDHYTTEREAAVDLIKVLGLIHSPLAPAAPLKRRF